MLKSESHLRAKQRLDSEVTKQDEKLKMITKVCGNSKLSHFNFFHENYLLPLFKSSYSPSLTTQFVICCVTNLILYSDRKIETNIRSIFSDKEKVTVSTHKLIHFV